MYICIYIIDSYYFMRDFRLEFVLYKYTYSKIGKSLFLTYITNLHLKQIQCNQLYINYPFFSKNISNVTKEFLKTTSIWKEKARIKHFKKL